MKKNMDENDDKIINWLSSLTSIEHQLFNKNRLIILSLLYALGPLTQGELREKCQLTWGSFSGHIDILEKLALIHQFSVPTLKGVRKRIDITKKGIISYNLLLENLSKFLEKMSSKNI